jgi:hypothetical protein
VNGARRARPPRLDAGAVISLRLATNRDDEALRQLAELSGRVQPIGPWVVAEVDGRLLAALPLAGGEPLGDPFRPTAELGALLALRAKQLGGGGRSPRTSRPSLRRRLGFTFGRRSRPPVLTS